MMLRIFISERFWSKVFILWMICLVVLNIIPNYTPESLQIKDMGHLRTDYIQHIVVFMLLTFFYFLAGNKAFINRFITSSWKLITAGVIFAAFAETLQFFVPGRTFNPVDLFLNITGLLLGIPIAYFVQSISRMRLKHKTNHSEK